jgi:hypothetical protein
VSGLRDWLQGYATARRQALRRLAGQRQRHTARWLALAPCVWQDADKHRRRAATAAHRRRAHRQAQADAVALRIA